MEELEQHVSELNLKLEEGEDRIGQAAASLERVLSEAKERIKALESRSDESKEEVKTLKEELGKTKSRLADAEAELAEREELERTIESFGDVLAQAQAMKTHYEERIRKLRAKITELRSAPANKDSGTAVKTAPEQSEIEIGEEETNQPSAEESWLEELDL